MVKLLKSASECIKIAVSFGFDCFQYAKYSNSYKELATEAKYEAMITYHYHVIEKGLTMPEPRLGFGQDKLDGLVKLCLQYKQKCYDTSRLAYTHALKVLSAYLAFHEEHRFEIEPKLRMRIADLLDEDIVPAKQLQFSAGDLFAHSESPFPEFCKSRHSIRNYVDREIPVAVFLDCVEMAQKSPSACNRQPNKIYIIKTPDLRRRVLELQNGNRGFGNLASALIVLSADVSVFRHQGERNEPHLNSGMFAMTLMYALHYHGIGSCALNWSVNFMRDRKLKKLLGIPPNEVVTLIVSCGYVPHKLHVALSPRVRNTEVVRFL